MDQQGQQDLEHHQLLMDLVGLRDQHYLQDLRDQHYLQDPRDQLHL